MTWDCATPALIGFGAMIVLMLLSIEIAGLYIRRDIRKRREERDQGVT